MPLLEKPASTLGGRGYELELVRHNSVLDYYRDHTIETNAPFEPLLLRVLYGEHTALDEVPAIAYDEMAADYIGAISIGKKVDEVPAYIGAYASPRTAARRLDEALAHYTQHLGSVRRPRPAAVREAIACGDIKLTCKTQPNYTLLGSLTLQQLTTMLLTERGYDFNQIGAITSREPKTIATYSTSALKALGVSKAEHAVRRLREEGIFKVNSEPRVPRAVMEDAGLIFDAPPAPTVSISR
jgi:DNA-binding NarL/FixJ family response regulator